MPPEMMMMVIPSAMMLITAVCRIRLDRFVLVRKYGEAIQSATNRTINVAKGSSPCKRFMQLSPARQAA
jgi:hypothetical protein